MKTTTKSSFYKFAYRCGGFTALFSFSLILPCCHRTCAPKTQNNLIVSINNDPLSLDPRQVTLSRDLSLMKNIYEGLFREHASGLQPATVESYHLSEDGTIYTFFLKKTLWSNGDPVTAQDFEESLVQLHSSDLMPSNPSLLFSIKNSKAIRAGFLPKESLGVKALAPDILQITLERPLSHFCHILAHPIFFPVHKSKRDTYTKKHVENDAAFISNGPFIISKYKMQDIIEISKNPLYWDASQVKLDKVSFKVFPDAYTTHNLFKQGEVHWEGSPWSIPIPNEPMKQLEESAPHALHSFPVMGTAVLICNTKKTPSNSINLRKALTYAIDREALLSLAGRYNSVAYSFLPPALSQIKSHPKSYLSREERESMARSYFEKAKEELSEKELEELSIIYPMESKIFAYVIQEIQQQWKEVLNFSVPIVGTEYHNFIEKRKQGSYTIASGGWIAEYSHPLAFLSVLGDPDKNTAPRHASKWKNRAFDAVLGQLYSSQEEDIKTLITQAEEIILSDYPIIPLYHYGYMYAVNLPMKNIYASPLGTLDLKYATIDREPTLTSARS
ncbi:peptide ABC transporter substrate-binding protein [Chlamydiifrater volucris]|uniref:peptide ABC transporter substrate-binding protein n=1 Tax=Chlamydiifrater volucris TaxID=2681470 RepID=UPI001BCC0442|nr:peptide ABC transporter substrate-binding protein [Chlamydiifrater volucris]